jgi:hypothetical protein
MSTADGEHTLVEILLLLCLCSAILSFLVLVVVLVLDLRESTSRTKDPPSLGSYGAAREDRSSRFA